VFPQEHEAGRGPTGRGQKATESLWDSEPYENSVGRNSRQTAKAEKEQRKMRPMNVGKVYTRCGRNAIERRKRGTASPAN